MLNFLNLSKKKQSNKQTNNMQEKIKLSIDNFENRLLNLSEGELDKLDKDKLKKLLLFILRKYQYENITNFLNGNEFYPPEIIRLVNDIYSLNGFGESIGFTSPVSIENIETHNVFLDKDIILAYPWNEQRFKNCIKYHGKFTYFKNNHKIIYLKGLGVYTVFGGNHSIANGIMRNEGFVECSLQIDIFELFRNTNHRTNNELYRILEVCYRNNIRLDRQN